VGCAALSCGSGCFFLSSRLHLGGGCRRVPRTAFAVLRMTSGSWMASWWAAPLYLAAVFALLLSSRLHLGGGCRRVPRTAFAVLRMTLGFGMASWWDDFLWKLRKTPLLAHKTREKWGTRFCTFGWILIRDYGVISGLRLNINPRACGGSRRCRSWHRGS
jgi:hypothetical protein